MTNEPRPSFESTPSRRGNVAELAAALAALALGLFVFVGSFSINFGAGYDRIGPRFFPWVVAAGLMLSGGSLALGALRSRTGTERQQTQAQTRPSAVGLLGLALGAAVLLFERAGFVFTSTLLFWLVARAFESRRPARDVLVGALLSVLVYVAFTRGLGLALPRGWLGGLL